MYNNNVCPIYSQNNKKNCFISSMSMSPPFADIVIVHIFYLNETSARC